jgi:basic amino acid/polyamine antiporter, APA family
MSLHLKKELRSSQYFTFSFGTIIGAAWVVFLGEWLRQGGPAGSLLAFIGGGAIMILVGFCYAETAALIPTSGGELAYTYTIFGLGTSFISGWLLLVAYMAIVAFEAVTIERIVSVLAPGSEGPVIYWVYGMPIKLGGISLGLAGMILITAINYFGAKTSGRFQDLLTYLKIILAITFITYGMVHGKPSNLYPLFQQSEPRSALSGVFSVLLTAPFWYAGFNVIPQLMEERSSATRPNAASSFIVVSLGVAIIFYSLVILSTSMTMPWQQLLGLDLPVSDAFAQAFGARTLSKLVLVVALLGAATVWNGCFISATRVLFALGRGHITSPSFAYLHPRFVSPTKAVLFVGLVATCGVFLGRSILLPIVNVASTCFSINFLLISIGVIKMRMRQPSLHRSYRVPGGIVTASVAVVASAFLSFLSLYQPWVDAQGHVPLEWFVLTIMSAAGLFVWVGSRRAQRLVTEQERRILILDQSNRNSR